MEATTTAEVQVAIHFLSNSKGPGKSGISNGTLKYIHIKYLNYLIDLISKLLDRKQFPKYQKKSSNHSYQKARQKSLLY